MNRLLIILATLLAITARAPAQDVFVEAQLTSTTAWLGGQARLIVTVSNSNDTTQPTTTPSNDFDLRYRGPSTSSQIIINNNRRRERYSVQHSFMIVPRRTGLVEIPPFRVTIGNSTYSTEALRLVVREPEPAENIFVEVETNQPSAYVGEPMTATLRILVGERGSVGAVSITTAEPDLAITTFPNPDPRIGMSRFESRNYHEFAFLDERIVTRQKTIRRDNQQFVTFEGDVRFTPNEAGQLTIGPVTFIAEIDATSRGRRERTRVAAVSDPATVTINALPIAGRPDNFSGLVGAYTLHAHAQPTSVNVGDPIELRFDIVGPAPLDLIPPISLDTMPELASRFKFPKEPTVPTITTSSASFQTTIRARTGGIDAIPPIEVSYFDARAGEYRIARSEPIPITVHATNDVTLAGIDDDLPESSQSQARPGGIAPIRRSTASLEQRSFSLTTAMAKPTTIGVLAVPPAIYAASLAGIAVRRRAERDPAATRRKRALKHARARLAKADRNDPESIAAALTHAICSATADLFDRPEKGLTAEDALALMQESSISVADETRELLEKCDAARFGQATLDTSNDLLDDARQLVTKIVHEVRASA